MYSGVFFLYFPLALLGDFICIWRTPTYLFELGFLSKHTLCGCLLLFGFFFWRGLALLMNVSSGKLPILSGGSLVMMRGGEMRGGGNEGAREL
jgi:hypothetical protein